MILHFMGVNLRRVGIESTTIETINEVEDNLTEIIHANGKDVVRASYARLRTMLQGRSDLVFNSRKGKFEHHGNTYADGIAVYDCELLNTRTSDHGTFFDFLIQTGERHFVFSTGNSRVYNKLMAYRGPCPFTLLAVPVEGKDFFDLEITP